MAVRGIFLKCGKLCVKIRLTATGIEFRYNLHAFCIDITCLVCQNTFCSNMAQKQCSMHRCVMKAFCARFNLENKENLYLMYSFSAFSYYITILSSIFICIFHVTRDRQDVRFWHFQSPRKTDTVMQVEKKCVMPGLLHQYCLYAQRSKW